MSNAENYERACELRNQGVGVREIARILRVPYTTVQNWLREPCKTAKNPKAFNADRHLCRTCRFRAGAGDRNHGIGCDYIGKMKKSRGCSAEECTVYEKRPRAKRQ